MDILALLLILQPEATNAENPQGRRFMSALADEFEVTYAYWLPTARANQQLIDDIRAASAWPKLRDYNHCLPTMQYTRAQWIFSREHRDFVAALVELNPGHIGYILWHEAACEHERFWSYYDDACNANLSLQHRRYCLAYCLDAIGNKAILEQDLPPAVPLQFFRRIDLP